MCIRASFWACEVAERDFTRDCTEQVNWSCTGSTGPTCRTDRISSNHPFSWHNSGTQMRFSLTNDAYKISDILFCDIHHKQIRIRSYVGFDIKQLVIERFRFRGIGQIHVNGKVVWTWGTNVKAPLNFTYPDLVVPFVNAGQTPIGFCPFSLPDRTASDISILSDVEIPLAGPSLMNSQNRPYIPMDEYEEIVIDLYTAYYQDNTFDFRLNVNGPCCSQISPTGGDGC